MKTCITILFLFVVNSTVAQTIAAFAKATDKIAAGNNKEIEYEVSVNFLKPENFLKYKITVSLDANQTTIPIDSIYLPANLSITIDKDTKATAGFKIKFKRDASDDKYIVFNLSASDDKGNAADLGTNIKTLKLLVKPLSADAQSPGDNLWFYTGTNVDLLDGVKATELYFKASYILNFKTDNNKPTNYWLYITGGKNRYSSASDSLARVSYSDLDISKYNKDSVYTKSGFYKSSYQQTTDNIYTSVQFLWGIANSPQEKFFGVASMYVGLQSLKMVYKNTILTTYSNSYYKTAGPSLSPIVPDHTFHQVNYNFGVGFMYRLSTTNFDIKFQATGGLNRFFYPYYIRESVFGQTEELQGQTNSYSQFVFEGTYMPLGISMGMETFIRSGRAPLFNASITKVLTLKQIGSLFTKTPSTN